MSRKCPSCKAWMASGQYTCKKCGAGETKSALSSADHIAVQNTISSLHDCWSTGYRVEQGQVERVKEKLAKALSFFNADTERSKYASNLGEAYTTAIQCNSKELLELCLPHLNRPFHELRDLRSGLQSPLFVAVLFGRTDCLLMMLKTKKDKVDWKYVEPKIGKTLHETILWRLEGNRYNYWDSPFLACPYKWGNSPAEDANTAMPAYYYSNSRDREEKLYSSMLNEVNIIAGFDSNIRGVQGMAVRAQLAAASGEIFAPPPFPRTIWVIIVGKCDLRERDVVLPLTCRFFRNLTPPGERLANIKKACGFKSLIEVPPTFFFFLAQGPNARYLPRLEAFARDHAYILAHPVVHKFLFRATIETAPHSKYWFDGARVPYPTREERSAEEEGLDFIALKLGDVEARMEMRSLSETPGRFGLKMSFSNSETRVVFRVKAAIHTERFGFNAGGTQALDRITAGINAAAAILGVEPHLLDAPRFVKLLSVLFMPCSSLPTGKQAWYQHHFYGQSHEGPEGTELFFEKFLLGESNEMKVKVASALELSQSQDVMEEDPSTGESLGFALKTLSWRPQQVADFFSKQGLPECGEAIVGNNITGRALVEGRCSSSEFVPKSASTKESFELIARVDTLRKKYWGYK